MGGTDAKTGQKYVYCLREPGQTIKERAYEKKSGALKMLKHFVWIETLFHCNEEQSEIQWNMDSEAIRNAVESYTVPGLR